MKQMAVFIVMILFFYNIDPVLNNDLANSEFNLENLETPTIVRRNENVLLSMKKNFNNKIESILEKSNARLNKNLGVAEIKSKINQINNEESPKEKLKLLRSQSDKIKEYLRSSSDMITATLNFLNLKVKEINEIDKVTHNSEADAQSNLELKSELLLKSLDKERKSVDRVLEKLKNQIDRLEKITEDPKAANDITTENENSVSPTPSVPSNNESSSVLLRNLDTQTGFCSKVKNLVAESLKSFKDIENFKNLKTQLMQLTESQCKATADQSPTSAAILVNRLTMLNWRRMLRLNRSQSLLKKEIKSSNSQIPKKSTKKRLNKILKTKKAKKVMNSRKSTKDLVKEFD